MSEYVKSGRYIDRSDIYKLFPNHGIARLHVSDIDQLPNADVVNASDFRSAIDEVLELLNFIHSKGQMEYNDYSELFDAISAIPGFVEEESDG